MKKKKNQEILEETLEIISEKNLSDQIRETIKELAQYEEDENIDISALNFVLGTRSSQTNTVQKTVQKSNQDLTLINHDRKLKSKQAVLNDIVNQLPTGKSVKDKKIKNNFDNNILKDIINLLIKEKNALQKTSSSSTGVLKQQGIIPIWEQFSFQQRAKSENNISKALLLSDMRRGLEGREFFYFYQPQWNVQTGQLACLESRLKWRHPTRGILGPDFFWALFEESGLLLDLLNLLFERVFMDMNQMALNGLENIKISLSLTPEQLEVRYLGESLLLLLNKMNINVAQIECAITERQFPKYPSLLRENLTILKENNVTLCLNNFASGYSAYPFLQEFHFDKIKLDKKYTAHLFENPREQLIVRSVIDQAHLFGSRAIIDGVNSPQMLNWLRDWKCDLGQGCLLGKARPLEEIIDFLKEFNTIKTYGVQSIEAFWRRNARLTPINTGSCIEE